MLALNHALFGANSVLLYSLYQDQELFLPVLILGVFASIIPDIDHPGSKLGKIFTPISKTITHRGITHSILGVVIFYLFINILFESYNQYLTYILIFGSIFGVYLFEKIAKKYILKIDNYSIGILEQKHSRFILKIITFILYTSLALLLFLIYNDELRDQMLVFIFAGYVSHLIGDFITYEGIPIFWPINKKFGLKLFKVGGKIEKFIGFMLFIIFIYLIYKYNIKDNIFNMTYWTKYF